MSGNNAAAGNELPPAVEGAAPPAPAAVAPTVADVLRAIAQDAAQQGLRVEPSEDAGNAAVTFGLLGKDASAAQIASHANGNTFVLSEVACQVQKQSMAIHNMGNTICDKIATMGACFTAMDARISAVGVEVVKETAKEIARAETRQEVRLADMEAALWRRIKRREGQHRRPSHGRSGSRTSISCLSSPLYSGPSDDDGPGRDGDAVMRDAPPASGAGATGAVAAGEAAGGVAAGGVTAAGGGAAGAAAGAGCAARREADGQREVAAVALASAPPGYAYVSIDGKANQLLHLETGRVVTLPAQGQDRNGGGQAQAGRGGYRNNGGRGGGRGHRGDGRDGSGAGPSGLNGGDPRDMICHTCGGRGHRAAQCPSAKGDRDGKKPRR